MSDQLLRAFYSSQEPACTPTFNLAAWQSAPAHPLAVNWRGEPAPPALHTTARLLWTPLALWLGFTCQYTELDMDETFDAQQERYALWERDVCEAFIQAPTEPSAISYKEFQVAPTGQWFDVAITTPRLEVQWDWSCGLQTAAAVDESTATWCAVMRIPFSAFARVPQAGELWRANLYRISRLHGARQFLSYAPTNTENPDYHVPARFVPLHFVTSADA